MLNRCGLYFLLANKYLESRYYNNLSRLRELKCMYGDVLIKKYKTIFYTFIEKSNINII